MRVLISLDPVRWHRRLLANLCVYKAPNAIQSNSIQFNWTHFARAARCLKTLRCVLCCVISTSNNHHIKYQVWTDVEGTCCGNVQLTHHFTVWIWRRLLLLLLLQLFLFFFFASFILILFSSTTTYYIILLLLPLPLLLLQIEILSSWFFYPASIWFFSVFILIVLFVCSANERAVFID